MFDNQAIELGPYGYALPGVRIALWGGGLITLVAGLFAWRSISRAQREDPEQEERAIELQRSAADADVARVRAAEEESSVPVATTSPTPDGRGADAPTARVDPSSTRHLPTATPAEAALRRTVSPPPMRPPHRRLHAADELRDEGGAAPGEATG